MATEKTANLYETTVASPGYTAGSGTVVVASATGAPTSGNFRLRFGNAAKTIFKVTSVSGTTYTGTAEANDSNAAIGDAVIGVLSAGALHSFRADQNRILTVSAFDALAAGEYQIGDRVRLSDGLYEAIYDGSAWQYFFGSIPVTRPPSAGWTWDNQGSSTISSANGFEHAEFLTSGGFVNMRCRYRTAPATPYTVTVGILPDCLATANVGWNIGFRDSSGKLVDMLFFFSSAFAIQTNKWTTTVSLSASYKSSGNTIAGLRVPSFLRMTDDGTNLLFYTSADKINWTLFDSRSRTDFFASGPTQIFYGSYTNGGQSSVSLIDWTVT